MKEDKELFDVWQSAEPTAELDTIAPKAFLGKSRDIFRKIKRNMITELIVSAFIAVYAPLLFQDNPTSFWFMVVLMVIAVAVTIKIYGNYFIRMRDLNEPALIDSLKAKESILSTYVRRLKMTVYVLAPISFIAAQFFPLHNEGDHNLNEILLSTAVGIPILLFFMWLMLKYIHWLYGKYLVELRNLIAQWESGVDAEG